MEIQLTSEKYIVSKNEDATIIHLVFATANSKFATGQPVVMQFDTLDEAEVHIDSIKGDGYAKENFKRLFETPAKPEE